MASGHEHGPRRCCRSSGTAASQGCGRSCADTLTRFSARTRLGREAQMREHTRQREVWGALLGRASRGDGPPQKTPALQQRYPLAQPSRCRLRAETSIFKTPSEALILCQLRNPTRLSFPRLRRQDAVGTRGSTTPAAAAGTGPRAAPGSRHLAVTSAETATAAHSPAARPSETWHHLQSQLREGTSPGTGTAQAGGRNIAKLPRAAEQREEEEGKAEPLASTSQLRNANGDALPARLSSSWRQPGERGQAAAANTKAVSEDLTCMALLLGVIIKALLLGVIIVLDGMILHTTHSTEFLQHITITTAIPNITPATAVSRTQVTISQGTRLTSLTPPPYGDLKPPPPNYGDLKPPTQGRVPMLFTSCGTSPHDLQVSPYSINTPGPLVMVLVCRCSDLGE